MVAVRQWFAGVLVLCAIGTACRAAQPGPVRIESGLVSGVAATDPAITVYRGLPYAAPPVGALRWRAPRAPAAWQGVHVADQFGSRCPQALPAAERATMSEDCLTLNVWSGAATGRERRPVFVWIYGGGFSGGSGSEPQFDGETLARKGLVVVTFNYRIGALGFLATPELSRESGHHASGNYGLLDDIAVLRWVQRNITAFGGDPHRVTIAGQSAGAGSVNFMTMSPLAKGLFQRAIAESHARHPGDLELRYLSVSWRPLRSAEAAGVKFVEQHGAHTLQAMRALSWQELLIGAGAFDDEVFTGSSAKPPMFRPVVDGWVLPHGYSETYQRRAQADVAFLTGNNLDETGAVPETAIPALRAAQAQGGTRPGAPRITVTLRDFQDAARQKFGAMADEFLRLYPAANDDEAAEAGSTAARDNSRVSTYLWGTEWTQGARQPVYTYFWTRRPPGPDHDTRGAYHGSEISYVFGNLYPSSRPWTDADRKIADTMSSYWANFAATGDPNGPGLPPWPRYDAGTPNVMQVGEAFGPMPVATSARTDFWKRFFATQEAW